MVNRIESARLAQNSQTKLLKEIRGNVLNFKELFSIYRIRMFLLVVSLALFAFTDSEFFRRNFDFQRLLYQYETQGPSPSYQNKLGIEVEGYYTEKGATDGTFSLTPYKDLIDLSRSTLGNDGYRTVRVEDLSKTELKSGAVGLFYKSAHDLNAPEKRLLFISDVSIFHPKGTKPVEVVSPILETKKDVDSFFSVLKAATEERGFSAEPLNSGTHMHFDFNKPQREEILILTVVIEKLLPEIKTAFSVQESRSNVFADAYTATDFESLVGFTKSVFPLRKTSLLNVQRHRATNWLSLEKHGTFEFRLFNSTTDPKLLTIQADLIGRIVKAVRLRDPKLLSLLKSDNLSGLTLDSVSSALDCLYKDPRVRTYARESSAHDVQRSKQIEHKLVPQETFLPLRGLTYNGFLNSASDHEIIRHYSSPYPTINYSLDLPVLQGNRCVDVYK